MPTLEVNRKLFEILAYRRAPATRRERLLRAIQEHPGRPVCGWVSMAPELGSSKPALRANLDSLKASSAAAVTLQVREGAREGPFCFAANQLPGVTVVPAPERGPGDY